MFTHKIINPPDFKLDEKIIKNIFKTIEETQEKTQAGTLNLVFVGPEEIKNLNSTYRKKDEVTDVLSFNYIFDFNEAKKNDIVGELVFCIDRIIEQGQEDNLGSEKEFYMLLIHSVLHILGYDHEEENDYILMKTQENKIWDELFKEKA
ncbi:MAG: rRNA maturation RNase YbeY [Candidatus Gracilibacteria bacterium]|nr:rRNA maturation RNase YbeY [Candidatus Gracilibacteria bacterium]